MEELLIQSVSLSFDIYPLKHSSFILGPEFLHVSICTGCGHLLAIFTFAICFLVEGHEKKEIGDDQCTAKPCCAFCSGTCNGMRKHGCISCSKRNIA